jgi:hypothetical protein
MHPLAHYAAHLHLYFSWQLLAAPIIPMPPSQANKSSKSSPKGGTAITKNKQPPKRNIPSPSSSSDSGDDSSAASDSGDDSSSSSDDDASSSASSSASDSDNPILAKIRDFMDRHQDLFWQLSELATCPLPCGDVAIDKVNEEDRGDLDFSQNPVYSIFFLGSDDDFPAILIFNDVDLDQCPIFYIDPESEDRPVCIGNFRKYMETLLLHYRDLDSKTLGKIKNAISRSSIKRSLAELNANFSTRLHKSYAKITYKNSSGEPCLHLAPTS